MTSHPTSRLRLALVLATTATTLAACGNDVDADVLGTAAVGVDAAGAPVALVEVCRGRIDTVEVHGDRTGLRDDEPNAVVGTWRAAEPRDGRVELSLVAPSGDWAGSEGLTLAEGRTYVLTAYDSDRDAEVTQVSFTTTQLAALTPERMIVGAGSTRPRAELDACDREE